MKLKCDRHDRRVMILDNGKWVHRTGDLSDCNSTSATIGKETLLRGEVDSAREMLDPSVRLLYDIFSTVRPIDPIKPVG